MRPAWTAPAISGSSGMSPYRSKASDRDIAVFAFLFFWNDFLWPLIVTNSDEHKTLQVVWPRSREATSCHWPLMMARDHVFRRASSPALYVRTAIFC